VLVYFSTLDGCRMTLWDRCRLWLVRVLTLSRIVHCDVGDGDVVLNVGMAGNTFWPTRTYLCHYPGIVAIVEVPGRRISLAYFEYGVGRKLSGWPTFWRWLNMGGLYNEDCLCAALLCLEAAGVPVDRNITTPIGLLRWLKHQGFPVHAHRKPHRFDARPAAQRGRVDCGDGEDVPAPAHQHDPGDAVH